MSDECKCKNCEYVDSSETDGYKWYCSWYRIYVDPDKWQECSHYRE